MPQAMRGMRIALMETYEGRGAVVMNEARMADRIGVDVARKGVLRPARQECTQWR